MEKQESSYELRSEKVRSIVGQIPPALVRYGTIILFAVLVALFGIAYFMPYKQVYSGTITFYDMPSTAYISFANDKALTKIEEPMPLIIHTEAHDYTIKLISIVNERDTLNRYPVSIEEAQNISNLRNRTFDFTLVESSGNLLSRFLPKR
nr:hypothetical protein [uncultured Porphyromonas sp.]